MWPKPLWIMLAATNTLGKPFVSLVARPLLRQRSTVRHRLAHAGVVHQIISCLEIYSVGLHLRSTRGLFTSAAPGTPSETLTGQKKDTSGDDTPERPTARPAAVAFCPKRASGGTRPSITGGST